MTEEKIKIGLELLELVSQTHRTLTTLKRVKTTHVKPNVGSIIPPDTNYSLTICEYSDGSGFKSSLSRYVGNTEVLDAIINVLEAQLERFQQQFDKL